MMKVSEFLEKVEAAARLKTIYIKGGFGIPMTPAGRARAITAYDYNYQRRAKIAAQTSDTFGFDCCGLVKGILWGFSADNAKNYGGAKYASAGVPDLSEAGLLAVSRRVNSDFSKIVPGACVYMPGHMGVYIGAGKVIEATPIWEDGVQITGLENIGSRMAHRRTWSSWGLLPYVDYEEDEEMTRKETEALIRELVPKILGEEAAARSAAPADAWAEEAIRRVKAAGMMVGDPDGNFRPQAYMRREELAAVLASMLPQ